MGNEFLKNAETLVLELLAIPGVSGQESEVLQFIARRLRQAGVATDAIRFDRVPRPSPREGETGNLVLRLSGTPRGCGKMGIGSGLTLANSEESAAGKSATSIGSQRQPSKRRLLVAHADTVPLCQGTRPMRRGRYIVPADKHTGLGADDRAGTAVLLAVVLEILRRDLPHPPLSFLWTVQEEVGLYGAKLARLAMLGKPHLAFNFDGGAAGKVTLGATGGYRMQIRIRGVASHAGVVPEKGVSAIAIASLAIAQLHRDGWHGRIEKNGCQGTSNIGMIHGGDATNVVTPEVCLRAEARSHSPAARAKIVRAIERAFEKAAQSVRNVDGVCGAVQIEGGLDYESFRLRDDQPSVTAACAAVRRCGADPILAVSNGGLDANWLTARGIPTVTLGCGQENGHTVSERLDLVEFRRACRIALCLATGAE